MEELNLLLLPGEVSPVAGQADGTALGVVAIDPLVLGHSTHFVDRIVQFVEKAAGRVVAGGGLVPPGAGGQLPHAPAAVAARSAEPNDVALYHHHPNRWVDGQQVVRRPQPGVAPAHDGNVDISVSIKCWPGLKRPRACVMPERPVAVSTAHESNPVKTAIRANNDSENQMWLLSASP